MPHFGVGLIKNFLDDLKDILEQNKENIEECYLKMGDQSFAISIKIGLEPDDNGTKYKVKMSYPSGAKIEHEFERIIDNDQMNLFDDDNAG